MSKYTNGWAWSESATEEQRNSAANLAACNELAAQIARLYHEIPDPTMRSEEDCDREADYLSELSSEEAEQYQGRKQVAKEAAWAQIEALEQLLDTRGGQLEEDYAHHNEFAQYYRLMEG